MKKFCFLFIFIFTTHIFAQSNFSTQSHQGQVNQIILSKFADDYQGTYFSAGDDGFVVKWTDDNQGEHYQISDVGIKLIACSPVKNLIAVYESDGGSVNKVSVWDWSTLKKKYQRKFSDSITNLSFSEKGTYLIIGTTTVDGTIFLRAETGTVIEKIKANTGIINFSLTTKTEKTCALYSPAGRLSYYDLQNGKLKTSFSVIKGLSDIVMYNDYKILAGKKDNSIYIINAITGKSISEISVNNPIILSQSQDKNLFYLEYDGRNNYELKMIESLENNNVSNPRIIKTMRGPRGNAAINIGTKDSFNLYLANGIGSIYKTESEPSDSTENLIALTEDTYAKIYGMVPSDSDFFFLTENSIYKSSYDTGIVDKLFITKGETQITQIGDNNVILWSRSTKNPITKIDLDKKVSEVLFTPKNSVQNLRLCKIKKNDEIKDYIVIIENLGNVSIFDFETKQLNQVYSGTGVQDAILTNDEKLYIAKTAATNPQTPLLCVNPNTMETVPLNVKGNVTYALSTNGEIIYGINLISDETGRNTYVFSFNIRTKQMMNILKFNDEDSEAFTYLYQNNLYTNIGKNKIYCYNINTKNRFSYNRSASIPKSICQNNKRVVILNNNGSISWCTSNSSTLTADWYLTKDEQWYEL